MQKLLDLIFDFGYAICSVGFGIGEWNYD